MRKLALAVLMVSAVGGGIVGCGGSSSRKPSGKAGAGGGTAGGAAGATGGSGGMAGGAAGDAAGAGGAAGDAAGAGGTAGGAAGAGGMAGGAAGAGGMAGGAAGAPPVQTYCQMHPELVRALPYTIAKDFKVLHVLSNNASAGYFHVIGTPDCSDNPTYPPFATDGGSDAGDEAGSDAGVDSGGADGGAADAPVDSGDETLTLQLDDPDAGDAGVADAAVDAPVDAPADAPVSTDGGTDAVASADAGPPLPACYELSYDPDGCQGACWAGVVFEVNDAQGPSADTQGVCIQTGAMSVEFWARASKNGARVKFGSLGEGMNTTEFYLNITTTWARYTVAIPASLATTYNETSGDMHGVWNAFSVVFEQQDYVGGGYVEVKDIHWLATP
jgi:hypothetical protein